MQSVKPLISVSGQPRYPSLCNITTALNQQPLSFNIHPWKVKDLGLFLRFNWPGTSRKRKLCSLNSEGGNGKSASGNSNMFSQAADEEVRKLLGTEENQKLLRDLQSAVQRVRNAQNELDDIEKQEKRASEIREYVKRLEGTQSMIADCMKEVSEVENKMRQAELELVTTRSRSSFPQKWEESDIDENAERIESVKAAGVSAVAGTLASIPLALFQASSIQELLFEEAVVFICCALFGPSYRYIVRRDLENTQLKTGAVAAFGLVKGLSQFKAKLPFDETTLLVFAFSDAAFAMGESLVAFMFAAISLDYCMKMDLLSPFPSRKISQD